jgi:hypothetical protein
MKGEQSKVKSQRETFTFTELPLDFDLLEQDLDLRFPDFSEGKSLWWGIVVAAVEGAWPAYKALPGIDWVIQLHPAKSLKIPKADRSKFHRLYMHSLPRSCMLIAARTNTHSMNEARDKGRPSVRQLAALIRREMPVVDLSNVLWEGALIRRDSDAIKMMLAAYGLSEVSHFPQSRLDRLSLRLLKISISELPVHLAKSLEWLQLARTARVRIEKFTHIWLAIITLTDYGQDTEKTNQKGRLDAYTNVMSNLGGTARKNLAQRLKEAYKVRNELWHEASDRSITTGLLESLERDAFVMVENEFVQIKKPISV